MASMHRSWLAAGLLAALVSVGSPARANFVTYSQSTPAGKLTDFTTSLAIQSFDPSLGTLTSVVISIQAESDMSGTVTNKAAGAQAFTITDTVNFAATFGAVNVADRLNEVQSTGSMAYGSVYNFGPIHLVGTPDPTNSLTLTKPADLSAFVGTSMLPFTFATQSMVSVTGSGGNTSNDLQTKADATVTVTYNFSPYSVPEPASLGMTVLGGVLAMAGLARGRARKAR